MCFQEHGVDTAVPVDNLGHVCPDLCGQAHVHLPAQASRTLADPAPEAGASTSTHCAPACALL